jgi:N-acetylglucosaminyldiphosphoundecaprenol N-acetyl-beta-D-mannosaminyltransferase
LSVVNYVRCILNFSFFIGDVFLKQDILGVLVDDVTLDEAVAAGEALLDQGGFHYVVTPNPEFILAAEKDAEFRTVLNRADLSLPDGIGVVYASKILGRPLKGRAPGADFAQKLLDRLSRTGERLYLLGAKPGVAEQAAENLCKAHPGLCICGVHDGYFKEDKPVVEAIRAAQADVIFVCLGAPKQELWMAKNGPACGVKLAVGLGGCLDVFAGNVQRAPEAWQKAGMEWLYRLIKEPSRIGRMAKLPLILVDALGARLGGKAK